MSIPLDLFQITPGNLGADYCFLGFQQLNVDILARATITQRVATGATFWNIGATTPDANHRIYPWLNTVNGRVYIWSDLYSIWTSPRAFSVGQIWAAPALTPESAIWSLDEGDGTDPGTNPPTPTTGAMWQAISQLAARFPIGVGTFPSTAPVLIGTTGGEEKHALTAAENGPHRHDKPDDIAGIDGYWAHMAAGGGTFNVLGAGVDSHISAQTGESGSGTPHNTVPPYLVVWFIQPTSRAYYTIPG